jgi:hypothetical protein
MTVASVAGSAATGHHILRSKSRPRNSRTGCAPVVPQREVAAVDVAGGACPKMVPRLLHPRDVQQYQVAPDVLVSMMAGEVVVLSPSWAR